MRPQSSPQCSPRVWPLLLLSVLLLLLLCTLGDCCEVKMKILAMD